MSEREGYGVRVLLVEDESTKRDRVARALLAVDGIRDGDIDLASDIRTARAALSNTHYDLLVLDVALPMSVGRGALRDGGATLLRAIVQDDQLRRPDHIVGLTGYDDVKAAVEGQFQSEAFVLLKYDRAQDEWEKHLQARLRHIIAVARARVGSTGGYASFLFVLCALPLELDRVLDLPWAWETPPLAGDETPYYHGTVQGPNRGPLDVYAASAPRMGMVHSAVLASKAIQAFRPRYLAMTGIAAGVRGKVELGDVVIGDPVWDYNSGKWLPGEESASFSPDPYQLPLDASVRDRALRLASRTDVLSAIRNRWPAAKPPSELRLHIGPLATGAAVVADHQTVERAAAAQRKLLGVEMEAFGVYAAAAEARAPRPTPFAIKAVVDFADPSKSDDYQSYGAYISAEVMRCLVVDHMIPSLDI